MCVCVCVNCPILFNAFFSFSILNPPFFTRSMHKKPPAAVLPEAVVATLPIIIAITTLPLVAVVALVWCVVHVIMGIKNMVVWKDVKDTTVKEIPAVKVDTMELDLSSLAFMRKFTSDFNSSGRPLTLLIQGKICPEPRLSSLVWIWRQQIKEPCPSTPHQYIYWTMLSDSQTGFPLWTRTGILLWTWFVWRSKALLFLKSCSLYSYFTPFSANSILTLVPNGLAQKSIRVTCSPAILEVKKKIIEVN